MKISQKLRTLLTDIIFGNHEYTFKDLSRRIKDYRIDLPTQFDVGDWKSLFKPTQPPNAKHLARGLKASPVGRDLTRETTRHLPYTLLPDQTTDSFKKPQNLSNYSQRLSLKIPDILRTSDKKNYQNMPEVPLYAIGKSYIPEDGFEKDLFGVSVPRSSLPGNLRESGARGLEGDQLMQYDFGEHLRRSRLGRGSQQSRVSQMNDSGMGNRISAGGYGTERGRGGSAGRTRERAPIFSEFLQFFRFFYFFR